MRYRLTLCLSVLTILSAAQAAPNDVASTPIASEVVNDDRLPPSRVLQRGIVAHGFLRLRCGDRGHDKLVALSRKRRGVGSSCAARRMTPTAAHLVNHSKDAVVADPAGPAAGSRA